MGRLSNAGITVLVVLIPRMLSSSAEHCGYQPTIWVQRLVLQFTKPPQAAYEMFDKVIVLYEGHKIYFGSTKDGKKYFENLGFECPDRQTDGDFLTSMTSAVERIPHPGWESRVPKTSKDFAAIWKSSSERRRLLDEIPEYDRDFPVGGEHLEKFTASRRAKQSKRQ